MDEEKKAPEGAAQSGEASEGGYESGNPSSGPADLENQAGLTLAPLATVSTKEDETYLGGLPLFALLTSITLVVFLILLDQSILSTAIPQITSDFHSLPDVGWYTGAYQLSSASFQPLTGKFYTFFRAKWTFIIFVFIFEAGSLVCALAQSSGMLIGGRVLAGLGASGLMNGGMTVISGATPLHKRPLYTGIMLGIGQIGIISGPLIGGSLTEYTTWRWCFYINLPLGGIAMLFLLLLHVPDLTVKEPFSWRLFRTVIPELDLLGFTIFAPASVMFLLALQFGGGDQHAWNSSVVIGLFIGAGVAAIVFGFWEYRIGDRAMIPHSIVRQRVVWASATQAMALMCCVFVASAYLPIYFQATKGMSPTISGVNLLPSILSQLALVIISGIAVSKFGYYLPVVVAGSAVTAIGNGLISMFSPTTSTAKSIGYQIVVGAGRGACMQIAMIAIQNALLASQIPVALAFLIFCQNFSAAVSVVIATTIFTQSLLSDIRKWAPSVDPDAALAAGGGAQAVRDLVPPGSPELDGVLRAYSDSVDKLFYLLVALAVVSFFASFGMGWKDIRKKEKKPAAKPEEPVGNDEAAEQPAATAEAKEIA